MEKRTLNENKKSIFGYQRYLANENCHYDNDKKVEQIK